LRQGRSPPAARRKTHSRSILSGKPTGSAGGKILFQLRWRSTFSAFQLRDPFFDMSGGVFVELSA